MKAKIQLLGTPSVDVCGSPLVLPLRKAEGLLYFVALEGRVTRERVASLLWGDRDDDAAHNNLRNAIYLLRRALPEGVLLVDRRFISLSSLAVKDTDVIAALPDINTPMPEVVACELLHGFDIPESPEYEEWLAGARIRVHAAILEALRGRIAACYDAMCDEKLERALELLTRMDPFDEDSVLELMELHFNRGNSTKAFETYRSYKARLVADMGLEPSHRAEDVFRRLVGRGQNQLDLSPDDCFYGRTDQVNRMLKIAGGGGTAAVLVSGDAGVGKTTLIRRILSFLGNEEYLVLSTKSWEMGGGYSYSAWNHLVSQLGVMAVSDKLKTDPLLVSMLSSLFPGLSINRRFSATSEHLSLLTEPNPVIIGDILADMAAKCADNRRLVLVFEDVHWFDTPSMQLFEAFLGSLSVPAAVFVTTRPEGLAAVSAIAERLHRGGTLKLTKLPLDGFTPEETAMYSGLFLAPQTLSSLGDGYFYRETKGLPLLLMELVKSHLEHSHVGSGLSGVILGRYGELPYEQRELLRVLSVFPNGTPLSSVGRVMGVSTLALARAAEALLSKRLISETVSEDGSPNLEFCHQKVRECIYESIPGFHREGLHLKAAEVLEEEYSPLSWDPNLSSALSYHYSMSGSVEKALDLHLKELIFHITLNHELFPLLQDRVLLRCSTPFCDRPETEQKMDQVRDLLNAISRKPGGTKDVLRMEASYCELRGGYFITWGQYREGRKFINRALQIAKENGFTQIHIHCLLHVCYHCLQTDNHAMLLPCAREMLHVAKSMGREDYMGAALRFIGVAMQMRGDFISAECVLHRSAELFGELAQMGKTYTLSSLAAKCYIGEGYHWQGKLEEAMEHFASCVKGCSDARLFWGYSHFCSHAAGVAFDMGDYGLMEQYITKGVTTFEQCKGGRCGSMLYSLKAITDSRRGDYDGAIKSLERGELLCAPIQKKTWNAAQWMAKAIVAKAIEEANLTHQYPLGPSSEYAPNAAGLLHQIFKIPCHNL